MRFTIPPFLKKNDCIGITATARWIQEDILLNAIGLFESWGFRVKVAPHVTSKNFQLAGSDDDRASDLQQMLNDPEIGAIVIARGGYGTVRLLEQLDFTAFVKRPKWICGYSDITALHALVNSNLGIASIHSTMPVSFPHATPEALENLRAALTGELHEIEWKDEVTGGSLPAIKSQMLGGNLSVIFSLLGSSEQLSPVADVLFIEDVDEMIYHIDRMMMGLKRSGMLDGIKALVVGGLTQMKDNTREFGFERTIPGAKVLKGLSLILPTTWASR